MKKRSVHEEHPLELRAMLLRVPQGFIVTFLKRSVAFDALAITLLTLFVLRIDAMARHGRNRREMIWARPLGTLFLSVRRNCSQQSARPDRPITPTLGNADVPSHLGLRDEIFRKAQ